MVLVGRSRCRWANEAVEDYRKRLRRAGGVDEIAVRSELHRGDDDAVRRVEGERLLKAVRPRDRLVVLDERGLDLDTGGFTELVRKGRGSGTLVFALGGAYGHSEVVRKAGWRVVRLSSLVMNHEVARVVLYEQLYRAMTIIDGVPYHH